jgi:hypothetical protein
MFGVLLVRLGLGRGLIVADPTMTQPLAPAAGSAGADPGSPRSRPYWSNAFTARGRRRPSSSPTCRGHLAPRCTGTRALPELIEAASRSENTQLAEETLARLAPITSAGGTDFGLGIEAHSRALLSEPEAKVSMLRRAGPRNTVEMMLRTSRMRVRTGRRTL